jgi:hypothetical protein
MADTFLRASLKLTLQQSRFVEEALLKLQDGYGAVRLHALTPLPFKAFVVNQGALRVICLQEGPILCLLHVDTHDAAYEWARRHKVVQVGRTVRILPVEVEAPVPIEGTAAQHKGPLSDVPDKVFRYFGIDALAAMALRLVPSEDVLIDLAQHLQNETAEALVSLALDPDEIDRIVREFESAKETRAPKPPIQEILRDDRNSQAIWIAPPGEMPLQRALQNTFAAWRIFLHPTQLKVVRRMSKGAVKVTGGPGTGKTVVALHRARFLAEEVFKDDPRPVLLTSFSRVLTQDLASSMAILAEGSKLAPRIVTRGITQVVQDVLRVAERPAVLLTEDVVKICWDEAMAEDTLDRPVAFYRSEREHVIVRHAAWAEKQYLSADRAGRHGRLDRTAKRKCWAAIAAFERAMKERGGGDLAALARDAVEVLLGGAARAYAAIVCDEVQDFGPAELRFVAALAASKDQKTRANALFLSGDGHQRIYRSGISLSACGIDIRGNSAILKLNYRTTEGIRAAAVQVIKGQGVDSLDEDEEVRSALDGYRSLRGGPPPEKQSFVDRDAEVSWIAETVKAHPSEHTLILARTNALVDELREKLAARGVEVRRLGQEDVSRGEGLVLCTLHRSKGLEAQRVIIAATDKIPARYPGGGDEADKVVWKKQEESLLYVGMSRARDWCALTGVGG